MAVSPGFSSVRKALEAGFLVPGCGQGLLASPQGAT